jgi:hypothetical protein
MKEFYVYSFEDTVLTAGTPAPFEPISLRIDVESAFELYALVHVAGNDNIRFRLSDDTSGQNWQNTHVDLRCISGKGSSIAGMFLPHWLKKPYVFQPGCNILVELADNSGFTNNIRLSLLGSKLKGNNQDLVGRNWKDAKPFIYTTGRNSITASTTDNRGISFSEGYIFRIDTLMAVRTGGALVTIKDAMGTWMDKAVHIDNLFGSAQSPHHLHCPRYIQAGDTLELSTTDISGLTNVVELVFFGVRLKA